MAHPIHHLSRRNLLKSMLAAGAAPWVIPGGLLGAGAQTRPSNKTTLGVIGLGDRGSSDMQDFLKCDDVRVTAICDVNKRRLDGARKTIAKRYGSNDVKVYSDFRELNADPAIDAVLMALPVHWHCIPSTDAILHGKHIYHEKPMGMSFHEAAVVRAAVKKTGVVFQFGTQQRSDMKFRWACELALNGRLGHIQEIGVSAPGGHTSPVYPEQPTPEYLDWERWVGPAPMTPFNEEKLKRNNHENMSNFSLGNIACWGIHHLDIAQWGNGADGIGPTSVTGSAEFPTAGSCDNVLKWNVKFEYETAAPINFVSDGTPGLQHGITFRGESATVHVARGTISAPEENQDKLLKDPANKVGEMPIKLPVSGSHVREFLDAIKSSRRAICDIDTAVHSDTLCQLAFIAVKLGRKLKWDPKTEQFLGDDAANAMLQGRSFRGEWKLPQISA